MLHPTIRRSPYFERTLAHGACDFMVYNHTYMPMGYGRDSHDDYRALVERVTLWDVAAERQCELQGPGALALADHLAPRRLADLEVGECRYTPVCDRAGAIMCECIVLRPWADVVWFSHSDVDLSLWAAGIALARGDDATVAEADVAPVQLQGPRAADVLAGLADGALAGVGRHRCAPMRIAGVDAVVSNTGWSREAGYEIYPLGSDRAGELWDALCAAGEPYGLLVTGPNIVRAVEQGISDTQYATNSDMNPIEAGIGSLLDLDRDFVGGDALRAVRDRGPARRTVGLVCDGDPFPPMERHWPVAAVNGDAAGVARWAVYSFALERNIAVCLVDSRLEAGAGLVVQAPDGPRRGEPHPVPFV